MLVLDAKSTFFDDDGKPLSGGRLRYFAFGTTTEVAVFSDESYTTTLGTSVRLTSAGWSLTNIYVNQSVTVHVDRYLGLDEFGASQYKEIKVYDYLTVTSGGSGSDSGIVDTLADLRDVTPTAGVAVVVKSYFAVGDCFPRTYIWDADSSALENLGTVIESSVEPTGRWLLSVEGPFVDSRIFGVIAGIQSTNSAFASAISYCNTYKKTLYFSDGQYYLTSGGSLSINCGIKADPDVRIHSTAGTYTITVTNGKFDVYNTFAGTNLLLILNGTDEWEKPVPLTAWDVSAKGYASGNAKINLLVNNGSTVYTWNSGITYLDITVAEGTNIVNILGYQVNAGELKGTGKIQYSTSETIAFDRVRTSNLLNYISEQITRTREQVILDTAVSLSNTNTSAAIYCESTGSLTAATNISCTGGLSGNKVGWINGSNAINCGEFIIDSLMWADGTGLINSFNASSSAILDLKGKTTTGIVNKAARIKNGAIHRVAATASWVELDHVTVASDVAVTTVTARDCSIGGLLTGSMVKSALTNVTLTSTGSTFDATNGDWTNVTSASAIRTNGNSSLRNVNVPNAYLVPNSSGLLAAVDWVGGDVTGGIYLDASQSYYAGGDCIAHCVSISGITSLSGDIRSVNGGTKKWADVGHTKINITGNFNAASTKGTTRSIFTIYSSGGNVSGGKLAVPKILCLGTGFTPATYLDVHGATPQLITVWGSNTSQGFGINADGTLSAVLSRLTEDGLKPIGTTGTTHNFTVNFDIYG